MLYPMLPPPEKRSGAAVIVCPGGAYRYHASHEGVPVAEWLVELGVAAFVLTYRLRPYQFPVPLLDAQRAIRTVRTEALRLGLDPARIGIIGFSAGGHLASATATLFDDGNAEARDSVERASSRPNAAMLIYPATHFSPARARSLLGDVDRTTVEQLSTWTQVRDDTPPIFLWHNLTDELVSYTHSLCFAQACYEHNVPCELHILGYGAHGFGMKEEDPKVRIWLDVCANWLRNLGFAESK
jgi:acetyl esterase/lipase